MSGPIIGPSWSVRLDAEGQRTSRRLQQYMPTTVSRALREFRREARNGLRTAVPLAGGSHYWRGSHFPSNHVGLFFVFDASTTTVRVAAVVDTRTLGELPGR